MLYGYGRSLCRFVNMRLWLRIRGTISPLLHMFLCRTYRQCHLYYHLPTLLPTNKIQHISPHKILHTFSILIRATRPTYRGPLQLTNTPLHSTTYTLRWVHTCNVTAYRNAVTLQVTDNTELRSDFRPVPHGVSVLRTLHHEVPSLLREPGAS
jgi:hypothetical protein